MTAAGVWAPGDEAVIDLAAIRARAQRVEHSTWQLTQFGPKEVGRESLGYAVAAMAGDDVPALICEIEHLRAMLDGVVPAHTCAAALVAGDYVVRGKPILYAGEK